MKVGLRIGFVSFYDASDATAWSGIPYQILKHLRAHEIDLEVVSPLDSSLKYIFAPAKLIARLQGKKSNTCHFPLVQRSYARRVESIFRQRPVDVIVSTSTIPFAYLNLRQPIVIWTDAVAHSMRGYYADFSELTSGEIEHSQMHEATALGKCSIAAYASTWAMKAAEEIADPSKLRVLFFGSSIPVAHTEAEIVTAAKRKREGRKNECVLLFVSTDWVRKGGDVAVETARLLNEAGVKTVLKVVGTPPTRPLPNFAEFLGFMNKNSESGVRRLVEEFRSADFFILPTKAEAAGIVFCEASSYGLPSLTYATGGVPDYVRNGVNGFCFAPEAPASAFSRKIRELLSDPPQYTALSQRAFSEYQSRLNWESSVKLLIKMCEDCVGA